MTRFIVSCERNAHEYQTAAELTPYIDLGITGFRVWATKGSNLTPSRGQWFWHSTDAALIEARKAGAEVVYLTLVGAPAHGTLQGKITYEAYTNSCMSWKLDANGNMTGEFYFNPELPWIKNPDRVAPWWSYDVGARAAERYWSRPSREFRPVAINGLLLWNEPDDRTYNPGMVEPYDESWATYLSDILLRMARGARNAGPLAQGLLPLHGPETAYASGLEALLTAEHAYQNRLFDVISFHCYGGRSAEDGGEPGETLNNAIKNLDEKLQIIEPYRNGRMIGISESGDGQGDWWPAFANYAISVCGDYLLYLDYNPKDKWMNVERDASGSIVKITPNALGLDAGKMIVSLKEQQRRRAVTP